jgi:hypothetical protein
MVVEREFEASIFTGGGRKGMYKLDCDFKRLVRARDAGDTVALVGRFKQSRKARSCEDTYTYMVRLIRRHAWHACAAPCHRRLRLSTRTAGHCPYVSDP